MSCFVLNDTQVVDFTQAVNLSTNWVFFMAKIYTEQEIQILSKNPNVKYVRENRLVLTFEFRLKLYDEWIKNPSVSTIRKVLNENGINTRITGKDFEHHLNLNFKHNKPFRASNSEFGVNASTFKTNKDDDEYLLSTGVFVKGRNGITFSNEFINEVSLTYPNVSIEDKLKEKGVDPDIVGYQRIYALKKKLSNTSFLTKEKSYYSDEVKIKYDNHPYVAKITNKHFVLKDVFYKDASLFVDYQIDEILKIFDFDSNDFSYGFKVQTLNKIRNKDYKCDEFIDDVSIITNRIAKLEEIVALNNKDIKESLKHSTKLSKKEVVKLIEESFTSKDKINISCDIGISRSSYYDILRNDDYGLYEKSIDNKLIEDYKNIKKVLDSDPYPMGKRIVYMKMDSICGFHYSVRKISKLMRLNGSSCMIRRPKQSIKENREIIKRNTKPNILNRRFRLALPNQIKITDVTYLKYGDNQVAYKSTIKDSVTGKIDACVVSDSNDLKLVLDTINQLDESSYIDKAIFHSDQGALYLNDYFQEKIKEKNLIQSMSKRGNSQDNASMESLFGHFKDECDYSNCSCLDEVRAKVDHYVDYYNNRRPQWNRNKMTPVEYEKYLLSLNKEEYDLYLKIEEDKYLKMKEKAKVLAIERNKTLGVESYYGIIREGQENNRIS